MKNKKQILMIHGGMTFKNQKDYLSYLKKDRTVYIESKDSWTGDYINKELNKSFQIIKPRMPLQDNAKYKDWKIWFERHIPYIKGNVILIGNSLGGIFLAKYLSENKFPKKIKAVFLVCPPYDNKDLSEDLVGGFKLNSDLSKLDNCTENLYLMFSRDDDVVPVSHADKYAKKLKTAKIIIYKSKNGHFQVSKFPEIIKIIKGLK